MRTGLRLLVGSILAMAGLSIGLFPLVSVWRASGQVLDELPSLSGIEPTDSRHRVSALSDPDFVLAQRVYQDSTAEQVREALIADGFASFALRGDIWYAKECCGDYDAVWASITEAPDEPGTVRLLVTTADGDIQSAAGWFGFLGLLLFISGAAVAVSGTQRTKHQRSSANDNVPEAIA